MHPEIGDSDTDLFFSNIRPCARRASTIFSFTHILRSALIEKYQHGQRQNSSLQGTSKKTSSVCGYDSN